MLRMRTAKNTGMGVEFTLPSSPLKVTATAGAGSKSDGNWEMRPCGMLVQKRMDSDPNLPRPLIIRVRVKYGSVYHQLNVSSQATFGELKKMLSGTTGLHHEDLRLMFKDKERDSNTFLDCVGVKDKSKIVLIEDTISKQTRYMKMKMIAKADKSAKSLSEITLDVDRLAGQVWAYESVISRGGQVAEKDLVKLIESLMNQLVKLDGIHANGDIKSQTKLQIRKVQNYVEKLDTLKIKNSTLNGHSNVTQHSTEQSSAPPPALQLQQKMSRQSESDAVVITTQWETFDFVPAAATTMPGQSSTSARGNFIATSSNQHDFNWDLLLEP